MPPEQFTQHYQTGIQKVYRFLRSRGVSIETAEELAQAAWVRAWEKRNQYRGECSLLSWVTTIAFRLYLSLVRHNNTVLDQLNIRLATPTKDLDAELDLETLLGMATEKQAKALRDYYIAGKSVNRAGRLTILRAKKSLRKKIHRAHLRAVRSRSQAVATQ
jgi:RNA polymerase sigma factor (sigma-70 family)